MNDHIRAQREGGTCPHCGVSFPAPPNPQTPGRFQVLDAGAGVLVRTETDGPQVLEVTFLGESVIVAVIDGDTETVVSIPRSVWDAIVEAGK